jgi:hypothetical protein
LRALRLNEINHAGQHDDAHHPANQAVFIGFQPGPQLEQEFARNILSLHSQ